VLSSKIGYLSGIFIGLTLELSGRILVDNTSQTGESSASKSFFFVDSKYFNKAEVALLT